MAAHLPGMCAALFPMPVVGVPMSGKNLAGEDALFSIVQMPPGIPVATVAIDGGMNAAILAAKILAVSDAELLEKLKAYTTEMKETVQAKAAKLDEIGYEDCFFGEGVCLVEWANLIEEIMPEETIWITIEKDLEKGFDYRRIEVK